MTKETKAVEVTEGARITILQPTEMTVNPKCHASNKAGHWYCVTHQKGFTNNLELGCHISVNQRHVMAWFCYEHQEYEVP